MVGGEPEIFRWGFGLQNHIMWSLASALWALLCSQCCCTKNVYSWTQRNSYWTENKSTATSTRVSYLYWLVLIGFCLLNPFPLSFLSAFYLSPKIRMIKKLFSCTSNYMFSCFSSSFVSPIFWTTSRDNTNQLLQLFKLSV